MPTLRLHGGIYAGLLKTLSIPKSSVNGKTNYFQHFKTAWAQKPCSRYRANLSFHTVLENDKKEMNSALNLCVKLSLFKAKIYHHGLNSHHSCSK